ncbi:MAG: BrnA antitoxin family protein [Armatimonadetes bacterium]|nr:BrnA antitoxin family protein [Armatimonadota bacterium]
MPRNVSRLQGWQPARHVVDPVTARLPTRRVTIALDEDIIAIFKAEALRGGPPYQVAINQALRAYLHDREIPEQDRAVQKCSERSTTMKVIRKLRNIAPGQRPAATTRST